MSRTKTILLALTGFFLVFAVYFVVLWYRLPDVSFLARENPRETAILRERGGKATRLWVPLSQISDRLVQAVIMGEDAGFYHHRGFDLHEMRKAFERNWEEGRTVRGASTITQQLAKNLFLSSERSYARKLKEAILTYRLEKALSKKRILELYLNVIEWGEGIYGAEAAARNVFGKSASELDAPEGALLAAMIPNPRRLDPCTRPKSVRFRQERILGWMEMAGHLTQEEHRSALEAPIWLRRCGYLALPEG